MNALQTLTFDQQAVRMLDRHGEPWFVAKDLCDILELGDVSKAVSRLDIDEKGTNSIPTLGGEQQMLCVNESGLYSLVLGSRKPEAKAFKRWITHEVLPAIRRDGFYGTPPTPVLPTDYLSALKALVAAEEIKESQAQQLALDAPKVALYEVAMHAINAQPIGVVAKELGLGQNRLFAWLRDEKILISHGAKRNLPHQEFLERGYFRVRKYSITHKQSGIENKSQTLVTPKGLAWIHARWQRAHTIEAVTSDD